MTPFLRRALQKIKDDKLQKARATAAAVADLKKFVANTEPVLPPNWVEPTRRIIDSEIQNLLKKTGYILPDQES